MELILIMNLENLSANKSKPKSKKFNNYGVVTSLVVRFKTTNSEEDLLEIIKALEGIINTYTIICTPPDPQQNIFITPYMTRFLGMFLTPEERIGTTSYTYQQAVQRVRWQLRHYTYEDMYAKILEFIIEIVRKMRVIGDCDCIYFIQKMLQYKMYDLVIKMTKDLYSHVYDVLDYAPNEDLEYETDADAHKFTFKSLSDFEENDIDFDLFYSNVNIDSIIDNFSFHSYLTQYEKFLYYLIYGLEYSDRQLVYVLRLKNNDEVQEAREFLHDKLMAIGQLQ